MGQEIPEKGQYYRHFEGEIYRILAVARHTETLEELVIYEGMYGDHPVYAKPLPMFMSKAEPGKFPESSQEYLFEKIAEPNEGCPFQPDRKEGKSHEDDEKRVQLLLAFLELGKNEEKLAFLQRHRSELDDQLLESIAQSLDFTEKSGDLYFRILDIEKYLQTLIKYERRR